MMKKLFLHIICHAEERERLGSHVGCAVCTKKAQFINAAVHGNSHRHAEEREGLNGRQLSYGELNDSCDEASQNFVGWPVEMFRRGVLVSFTFGLGSQKTLALLLNMTSGGAGCVTCQGLKPTFVRRGV
jgi:hypothetical protein